MSDLKPLRAAGRADDATASDVAETVERVLADRVDAALERDGRVLKTRPPNTQPCDGRGERSSTVSAPAAIVAVADQEDENTGRRALMAAIDELERAGAVAPAGVLTDGRSWTRYALVDGELLQCTAVALDGEDSPGGSASGALSRGGSPAGRLFSWLARASIALSPSEGRPAPTPGAVASAFGPSSPTYVETTARLAATAEGAARTDTGELADALGTWLAWFEEVYDDLPDRCRSLTDTETRRTLDVAPAAVETLSTADALAATDDRVLAGALELFVRQTYLAVVARTFVARAALGPRGLADALGEHPDGVLDGRVLSERGVGLVPPVRPGEAESDAAPAFDWPRLSDRGEPVTRPVERQLSRFARRWPDDPFRRLYEGVIDRTTRRDRGEFYTPRWLAQLLAAEAIEAADDAVLDPACGTATVLRAALDRKLERERAGGGDGASDEHGGQAVRARLSELRGIDRNPLSAMLARGTLVLSAADALPDDCVAGLSPSIRVGDGLDAATGGGDGARPVRGSFDAVVGNPPWRSFRAAAPPIQARVETILDATGVDVAPRSKATVNLAVAFFLAATALARPGGRVSFVLPLSVLDGPAHLPVVRRLCSGDGPRFAGAYDLGDVTPAPFRHGLPSAVLTAVAWDGDVVAAGTGASDDGTKPGSNPDDRTVVVLDATLPERDADRTAIDGRERKRRPLSAYRAAARRKAAPQKGAYRSRQGATITPLPLWAVAFDEGGGRNRDDPRSENENASTPADRRYRVRTAPRATDPSGPGGDRWAGVELRGECGPCGLFSVVTSTYLVPFAVGHRYLAQLPARVDGDGPAATVETRPELIRTHDRGDAGDGDSGSTDVSDPDTDRALARWSTAAQRCWSERRTEKSPRLVTDRLDYQGTLSAQRPTAYRVVHTRSRSFYAAVLDHRDATALGAPLSAARLRRADGTAETVPTAGVVTDNKLHSVPVDSATEAYWLMGLFNSDAFGDRVMAAATGEPPGIYSLPAKLLNERGLVFDPDDDTHRALAGVARDLEQSMTATVREYVAGEKGVALDELDDTAGGPAVPRMVASAYTRRLGAPDRRRRLERLARACLEDAA